MKYLALLIVISVLFIPSASAQSMRVAGIPQVDCPVVVEQQENARDGSLKTADFKNFSGKTVDSIRLGWVVNSPESSRPSEAVLGMSTTLHPVLNPRGEVTLGPKEMGIHSATTGRLKFYVASGHFSDGSRFVCSAKSIQKHTAAEAHIVAIHDR